MKLIDLLNDVEILNIKADIKMCISSVSSDSKNVTQGGLFIAIKGEKRNGNDFIENAINNGAVAIITDDDNSYRNYKNTILVKSARTALSRVWSNYYCNPQNDLKIIAITGTNGKTSTAYFLYNILKEAKKRCALISTIDCYINDKKIETNGGSEVSDIVAAMTTPDPKILFSLFSKMKEEGVEYVVMEASSHALEQEKLSSIQFLCGIFTNLSGEHMDFHKNMNNYFLAKAKLFSQSENSIINVDDEYGKKLLKIVDNAYSCSFDRDSDFSLSDIEATQTGCKYKIKGSDGSAIIKTKIPGKYTVFNSALAYIAATLVGIDKDKILDGINNLEYIDGRLERIGAADIYIDYAHTPKAMENVINTVRSFAPHKRLIVLFGCGGDRDREKRQKMGEIASKMADLSVITSDNSRNEDSVAIIKDILTGVVPNSIYCIIPKREDAIKYAVKSLGENDILLLLGKGHEKYEIDKRGKHPFNERKIVEEVLRMK